MNKTVKIIHVFGAAGSGVSTLGKWLSEKYDMIFLDVDKYHWLDTPIPYTKYREPKERLELLKKDIDKYQNVVISGAICGWGDELIHRLDLVIKVETPTNIRIKRLKKRELEKYGSRIQEGGDMYKNHLRFIRWAKVYDDGGLNVRSNRLHNHWLTKIKSKKIVIDGTLSKEDMLKIIEKDIVG